MSNLTEVIYEKLNRKLANNQEREVYSLKNLTGQKRKAIEDLATSYGLRVEGDSIILPANSGISREQLADAVRHFQNIAAIGTPDDVPVEPDTVLRTIKGIQYDDSGKERTLESKIKYLRSSSDVIPNADEIARKAEEIKEKKGKPAAENYLKNELNKIRMRQYVPEKQNYFAEIFRKERAPAIIGGTIAGLTPFFFTKNWVIRSLIGSGLYGATTYGLARYITAPKELPEDLRHQFAIETAIKGIPVYAAGTITALLANKLINKLSRRG